MPKKFFDIIPPQRPKPSFEEPESREETKPSPPELDYDFRLPREEEYTPEERKREKRKTKRIFGKSLILVLVLLIIIGITGYFIFAKTRVEVWPTTEILDLRETVTIDSTLESADLSAKVIPGRIFQDKRSASQEFQASGKTSEEKKAGGTIRVYNAYSTSSQVLVATTRFVSAEGKLFRSLKREVISGGKYEKGKFVPGYTDIEVQAAEPGQEYNIGPSTFSIPGFAGTAKYTAFYGKSFAPMTGGSKGEVSQVTSADLEEAKNVLADKLKKESKKFLKNIIPTDYILLDELISQEIIKESSSVEPETEADSFSFETEIESESLVFKRTDIENFARDLINSNISPDKEFQEESLKINYSLESKEADKAIVNLKINVKVYPKIDLSELKKAVSGKSFQEVKIFLTDQPQITKIEIKSAPFWRKKIPEKLENIEIVLNLD